MSNRAELKKEFLNKLTSLGKATVSRTEIKEISKQLGITSQWYTKDPDNRVGRGQYKVPNSSFSPVIEMSAQVLPMTKPVDKSENRIQNVQTDLESSDLIPKSYKNYVPFGNFEDVLAIVNAHRFFPVFVTGHSGNGKTMSIEQACAKAKRKFVCVSMTPETDESDLLGNYVLINGNMEWRDGPVTTAARQGAVLCIDEIDFSIKTTDYTSKTDLKMKIIKEKANHILGATATPFALFSTEKNLTKIKKINESTNYKGIDYLDLKFVDPIIIKNINRFPHCDYLTINKVYRACLEKDNCVLLHSVIKEKIFHTSLMYYISKTFPQFTVIVYNGDGIVVKCSNRTDLPFAKNKSYNKYKQLIRKYYFNHCEEIHVFEKYSISDVLQILKDDPEYNHTHISIISGNLASRGISFVSNDYSLHLTDQYFHPSRSSHGENLLQSLRILGCYNDSKKLTLWCSKHTWESILEQHNIINKCVNMCDNSINWFAKLQSINIKKPVKQITRPRLTKNISWNPLDYGEFNLGITYPITDSSDSE
jgi:hypothetical protein